MGSLRPWHIILIVVVLVLLFGAKRLPDAARSLGRSLRIIKAETQGLINENSDVAEKADAQHSREPLNGEVQAYPPQQPYGQQPYGQQQPQPQYQQQPPQYQQQPPQPQGQPYADPTAAPRANER
jgi:sec-independent protein translocase protein TatA